MGVSGDRAAPTVAPALAAAFALEKTTTVITEQRARKRAGPPAPPTQAAPLPGLPTARSPWWTDRARVGGSVDRRAPTRTHGAACAVQCGNDRRPSGDRSGPPLA